MNFQTMYNEKLTSAEDAVKVVNSGDWVDYGWGTGTLLWQNVFRN